MSQQVYDFVSSNLGGDRLRYTLSAAGAALALWTIIDQRRWKSLDTGGLHPTWPGYFQMTILRVWRLFKGGDLRSHHRLNHEGEQYLRQSIEPRQPPRPVSREWPLPQRIEVAPVDPAVHVRIFGWTEKFVKENPDLLVLKPSKGEGFSAPAIYAKPGLKTRNLTASDKFLGDEIFHVHPVDSSLHVWLAEADLKTVISRGWGERFPLSVLGVLTKTWGFVYTPRTMEECDIVEEIIRAGIEYVTGQKPAASSD